MADDMPATANREPKGPAERLMDAAEKCIAERGSGVSNREILVEAGQRHNSAIAYHFGTRQNLIDAVWQRGSEYVNLRRAKTLANDPRSDQELSLLVRAWVTPFTEYMDDRRPSYWARFNDEALRRYPQMVAPELRRQLGTHIDDVPLGTLLGVLERLEELTCGGTQPEASIRVSTIVRGVISTLAAWERDSQDGPLAMSATALGQHLIVASLAFLQA